MSKFAGSLLLVLLLLLIHHSFQSESSCLPSSRVRGWKPPLGDCNVGTDTECCVFARYYDTYTCSPQVSRNTMAILTLNTFGENSLSGAKSDCDSKFHSDNESVVALSTGWYNRGSRCGKYIVMRGNGCATRAKVVTECDSKMGCDGGHGYRPPCRYNIVDASSAVWRALGVPGSDWGELNITWSD